MNSKYDDEIREAEQRLIRDRQALVDEAHALVDEAHALTIRAREAAASPKGLFAAFVIGYVVGELTAPRRRDKRREAAVATTKKVGIGGLLGSAVLAYVRSQYGSPWVLGRRAWDYYAATRQSRRAAMERSGPVRTYTTPPGRAASSPPRAAPAAAAVASTAAPVGSARVEPVGTTESHAAG
jgi:hypothetical protein